MLHPFDRENNRFKSRYGRNVRLAVAAAVVFHVVMFVFFPPFEFKPYDAGAEPDTMIVQIIPQYKPPEALKEPTPPPQPPVVWEDPKDENYKTWNPFKEPPIVAPAPVKQSILQYIYDKPPVLERSVEPVYPDLARQGGIEGTVVFKVLVGVDGTVKKVEILMSDVTPAMEAAARKALQQFRFQPAKQGANAVEALVAIPFEFRLHG